MARPARFERTAFGSGGQRSIRLSYGRIRTVLICRLAFPVKGAKKCSTYRGHAPGCKRPSDQGGWPLASCYPAYSKRPTHNKRPSHTANDSREANSAPPPHFARPHLNPRPYYKGTLQQTVYTQQTSAPLCVCLRVSCLSGMQATGASS